tara:strand:+ start:756 stop:1511 length:756 start_codon:yes stop_codon:yes gene_type:complete
MDKMIHTALNSMHMIVENQSVNSQNLSNINVPGYRRDLGVQFETTYLETMDGLDAKAFALRTNVGLFSNKPGYVDNTGEELDVAIKNTGFFFVKTNNGETGLSRRGDFNVSGEGFLVNGALEQVLDAGLEPIEIPPYKKISISENGTISLEPLGGEPGVIQEIGQLGTTSAEGKTIFKSPEGILKTKDGALPEPDQQAVLMQKHLERSNINAVEEMIISLDQQRQFELNVKLIKMAKDLDEGSSSLMKLPS